jgi:HPt (histidine-containing phosphotransfer) domain-containing protein
LIRPSASKGSLQVIGATTAAELAQDLEALAREGNTNGVEQLAAALEREVDRVLQSLPATKRG